MCSQNQNFLKFISVFHKKTHFTQKWNFFIRVDTLFSSASLTTVSNYSTPKHKRTRHFSQCTRFVFFFSILDGLHKFFIFHTGFSLVGFTRHVHVLVCFPMSVYLLMPLLTNMWDPPLPFTPLLSTGQVDRPGLFECLFAFTMPVKYCNMESARNSSV